MAKIADLTTHTYCISSPQRMSHDVDIRTKTNCSIESSVDTVVLPHNFDELELLHPQPRQLHTLVLDLQNDNKLQFP